MITIYIIIAITCLISYLCFESKKLFQGLMFNPYSVTQRKEYKRLLTYGFVHADYMHLIFNMIVLYSFGAIVVQIFGIVWGDITPLIVILFYLSAIIISTLNDLFKHKNDIYYNAVGASGAVSAILFSSILIYPAGKIGIMFMPFNIPAPIFGVAYLFYCWYMNKRANDNIGHNAHFWGAVYGILFTLIMIPGSGAHFMNYVLHYFS